jgi:hypothetical protein
MLLLHLQKALHHERMLESYRPLFMLQDITVDSFAIRILRTEELGAGNTIQVSYGTVRYGTSLYVSVRFTFLDVGYIAGT